MGNNRGGRRRRRGNGRITRNSTRFFFSIFDFISCRVVENELVHLSSDKEEEKERQYDWRFCRSCCMLILFYLKGNKELVLRFFLLFLK